MGREFRLAAAALLCACLGASAGAYPGVSAAPVAPDFAAHILDLHNRERQRLGIRPLAWSDSLATDARTWAETMAHGNFFAHSPGSARHDEGENLFRGSAGEWDYLACRYAPAGNVIGVRMF